MSGCHNPNEKGSKCRCMACRVEKLEEYNINKLNSEAFGLLLCRIENLEEEIKVVNKINVIKKCNEELILDFGKRLKELEDKIHNSNKKPHKCPVCDGLRTNNKNISAIGQSVTTIIMVDCHACAGKGIVWG